MVWSLIFQTQVVWVTARSSCPGQVGVSAHLGKHLSTATHHFASRLTSNGLHRTWCQIPFLGQWVLALYSVTQTTDSAGRRKSRTPEIKNPVEKNKARTFFQHFFARCPLDWNLQEKLLLWGLWLKRLAFRDKRPTSISHSWIKRSRVPQTNRSLLSHV